MPYIKIKEREFILNDKGFDLFVTWLGTIPVQERKGFVAFATEYMAKYSFTNNYFGKSTGVDAVRSAYIEMQLDLLTYEKQKRDENGEI